MKFIMFLENGNNGCSNDNNNNNKWNICWCSPIKQSCLFGNKQREAILFNSKVSITQIQLEIQILYKIQIQVDDTQKMQVNGNTSTSPRTESSTMFVTRRGERKSFNQSQNFGNGENGIQIKLEVFNICCKLRKTCPTFEDFCRKRPLNNRIIFEIFAYSPIFFYLIWRVYDAER